MHVRAAKMIDGLRWYVDSRGTLRWHYKQRLAGLAYNCYCETAPSQVPNLFRKYGVPAYKLRAKKRFAVPLAKHV